MPIRTDCPEVAHAGAADPVFVSHDWLRMDSDILRIDLKNVFMADRLCDSDKCLCLSTSQNYQPDYPDKMEAITHFYG